MLPEHEALGIEAMSVSVFKGNTMKTIYFELNAPHCYHIEGRDGCDVENFL